LGQSFQDEFLIGRAGHASDAFSQPLLHTKADACVRAVAPLFNAEHARRRHTRRCEHLHSAQTQCKTVTLSKRSAKL
jgi:hypothetical protein